MEKFAKFVRIITVAPVMALLLCLLLYFSVVNCFDISYLLYICIALLCIVPALAYPIERLWHPYQKAHENLSSRMAERELAIKLSVVCYGLLTLIIFCVSDSIILKQMVLTFFLSVILMFLISKIFKINPSGHLCGVVGPTVFLAYTISPYFLLAFILIGITIWSSLKLKRHTPLEVVVGALIPIISFIIAIIVV